MSHSRGASAHLLTLWDGVSPGTVVTLRREGGERTRAWTAGGPYRSSTGVAVIGVQVGGVVVAYPLDRVSLGWTPRPAVTLAAALDPAPVPAEPAGWISMVALAGCAYFVMMGVAAIVAWVLR